MAVQHITGFEERSSMFFMSSGGTFSFQNTTARNSGYALRCNPTTTASGYVKIGWGSGNVTGLGPGSATYLRFYFRYATKPAANYEAILQSEDYLGNQLARLIIDSTGKLLLVNTWTATILGTSTAILDASIWYRIELKLTSTTYELRINGITQFSGSTTFTGTGSGSSAPYAIYLGKLNYNGNTVDFFFDDFLWDNAAFPGEGSCVLLMLTGDGTYTDWTASAGSRWSAASIIPPAASSPGTYIEAQTDNYQYSGDIASASASPNVINAIRILASAVRVTATNKLELEIHSGGTTDTLVGVSITDSTTPTQVGWVWDTDPATGAAWTNAAITALQAGVKLDQTGGSGGLRIQTLVVAIDYASTYAGPIENYLPTSAAMNLPYLYSPPFSSPTFLGEALPRYSQLGLNGGIDG